MELSHSNKKPKQVNENERLGGWGGGRREQKQDLWRKQVLGPLSLVKIQPDQPHPRNKI